MLVVRKAAQHVRVAVGVVLAHEAALEPQRVALVCLRARAGGARQVEQADDHIYILYEGCRLTVAAFVSACVPSHQHPKANDPFWG